jgi:hypothetical protein
MNQIRNYLQSCVMQKYLKCSSSVNRKLSFSDSISKFGCSNQQICWIEMDRNLKFCVSSI